MSRAVIASVAVVALLTVGCEKSRKGRTAGEITILCGGSFRPPMEKLAEAFNRETDVLASLSFGQSEDLLPQVKLGKTGDVFVTHDPYLDYTKDAGGFLEAVQVGYVAPVLVVRKGNPAGVKSIEDLAQPGVKIALPNPDYSTCGEMLFALLEKKGIKDAVVKNAGNAIFRSHSQTGNALKLGTVDAGVMWNGIAHNFLDAIEIVPTKYEYDKVIRVWVIGLSYTEKKLLVEKFLDFCRTNAKKTFEEFGYVK